MNQKEFTFIFSKFEPSFSFVDMGSSSSRHQPNLTDRTAPLARSVSFPSYADSEGLISDQIGWASGRQDYQGNDMFEVGVSMHQHVSAGHKRYSRLKPKGEDRTISVPEERSGLKRSPGRNGLDCRGNEEDRTKAAFNTSTLCRPLQEATCDKGLPILENKLSVKVSPSESFPGWMDSGASSFRCAESLDANTGLRLLLSPVMTPSRSIAASSRFGNLTKTLSSSGRLNQNLNDDMDLSRALQSLSVHERSSSPFEIEGMGDSEEPGSPLFDPAILATFEMAIEASSDDTWPTSSEVSTSSSSRVAGSSSDMCSDADSANCTEECGFVPEASESMYSESGDAPKQGDVSMKRDTDSNSIHLFGIKQVRIDYLEDFEPKFPPYCEDKIVLYFTSLRGIRKTYENCCLVRLILKGFGVHVDERDIWMHSKFKEELANIMGAAVPVPRLFIKGRYIGGAEDVKRLHEEGVLQNLLEGLPAECDSMCDVCGGVRFLPCTTCSGSCKMVGVDEISRCPDCNENGLILCPSCGL